MKVYRIGTFHLKLHDGTIMKVVMEFVMGASKNTPFRHVNIAWLQLADSLDKGKVVRCIRTVGSTFTKHISVDEE